MGQPESTEPLPTPLNNALPEGYSLPVQQVKAEFRITDSYGKLHPNPDGSGNSLMALALEDLHVATGLMPRGGYNITQDAEDAAAESGRPVRGYADETTFHPGEFSEYGSVALALSYRGGRERNDYVAGSLPNETHDMLAALYALVGAQIARDDRGEGGTDGIVVRDGSYLGEKVTFVEEYGIEEGQPYLRVHIVGAMAAEAAMQQLSSRDLRRLASEMGSTVQDALRFAINNDIGRNNLDENISIIRELGAAMQEAAGAARTEGRAQRLIGGIAARVARIIKPKRRNH